MFYCFYFVAHVFMFYFFSCTALPSYGCFKHFINKVELSWAPIWKYSNINWMITIECFNDALALRNKTTFCFSMLTWKYLLVGEWFINSLSVLFVTLCCSLSLLWHQQGRQQHWHHLGCESLGAGNSLLELSSSFALLPETHCLAFGFLYTLLTTLHTDFSTHAFTYTTDSTDYTRRD